MTKTEIAQTIIDICQTDASFCADIKGGDPSAFLAEIADDMPERDFLFAVDKYLAGFRVWGHLYFYKKRLRAYIGFRVRRYGSSLFVTHAEEELPFSRGDEVIAIDGMTIDSAAEKFAVLFDGDAPDRQGERWETVIAHANTITVRSRNTFGYAVRTDVERRGSQPSCVCKPINKRCFYIKLTNFYDEQDISAIMAHAAEGITRTQNLIIDLRENCGGNDTEFLPLLPLLLAEKDVMCGRRIFTDEEDILYTERNVAARVKMYEQLLASATSAETRKYIAEQMAEQARNRGKGFLPAKADEFVFPASGTRLPERVVVLTDCLCASSAESFVSIASRLQKVTVIGRPTMGVNDYANLAVCDFGEYALHYPTSRSRAIDLSKGTRGKGLAPDVYVPWTPQHIFEDVDLVVALDRLQCQNK